MQDSIIFLGGVFLNNHCETNFSKSKHEELDLTLEFPPSRLRQQKTQAQKGNFPTNKFQMNLGRLRKLNPHVTQNRSTASQHFLFERQVRKVECNK